MNRRHLMMLTALLVVIAILHTLAFYFYWYYTVWWFDLVMHTLGGLLVGGTFAHFYVNMWNKQISVLGAFVVSITVVFAVGVGWEVFEFLLDKFLIRMQNDVFDTVTDLGLDIVGGFLGALLISKYFLWTNRNQLAQ